MHNLYKKARESLSPKHPPPTILDPAPILANQPPIHPVLSPRFTVPAILHPTPYRELELSVSGFGLLICPTVHKATTKYLSISWGSTPVIQETEVPDDVERSMTTTIFGILGVLTFFKGPYLFVITAKADLGELYKDSHAIHSIRGVAAIPLLDEASAIAAIKMIALKRAVKAATTKGQYRSIPEDDVLTPEPEIKQLGDPSPSNSPHIRFTGDIDKNSMHSTSTTGNGSLMLPPDPSYESLESGQTTPAGSNPRSVSPAITNNLLNRLSFWKRRPQTSSEGYGAIADSQPDNQDDSDPESDDEVAPAKGQLGSLLSQAKPPTTVEEKRTHLEAKAVKEIIKEFSRGVFFYSYDFDLSRSVQHKHEMLTTSRHNKDLLSDLGARALDSPTSEQPEISPMAEPQSNLPLWRRVDRKFWWNEHMSQPLTDAGAHNYVLPILQGYFQLAAFHLPNLDDVTYGPDGRSPASKMVKVQYTIISRRSKERAGLRFQRRGIDEDGNVANFVETETVVQVKRQDTWNLFSHVQIRGSIPLYWNQSALNLKPPPVLDRPRTESMDVLQKHFERITNWYGAVTAINVAELAGKEAQVTTPYREALQELQTPKVSYQEFDFHRECAGMHYENIAKLVSRLERTFESQGFFWVSGSIVLSRQQGVFRVNCIDCLDRTNVVMSAFSRHALVSQLEAVALLDDKVGTKVNEMEKVFNDVWANNGDAISRAYAGTSALKGDYTRTGRRDLAGILNDGMNSVMRMYTSTFSDYFAQACIDYFLGNRNTAVFSEFLANLSSTDPKEIVRLSKIRAAAIETATEMVLYEGERLIQGWTLLSPLELNAKVGKKFVEKVLLLSDRALYIVNFEYQIMKVKMYTRVPLTDIIGIQKGAYILSAVEEAGRIVEDNYGLLINFLPRQNETRISSYAVQNQADPYPSAPPDSEDDPLMANGNMQSSVSNASIISNKVTATLFGGADHVFAAFKAMPVDLERETRGPDHQEEYVPADPSQTCKRSVDQIVAEIQKACVAAGKVVPHDFVVEQDVVSVAEAQRLASIYSKFEYGFKRLLWLGVA